MADENDIRAKLYLEDIAERSRVERAQRNDPLTRVGAVQLVLALEQILESVAYGVAVQRKGDHADAWEIEAEADLLIWQLTEFLGQAEIDYLNPVENMIVSAHHVSDRFVCDWFLVSRSGNNSRDLIAL